MVSREIAVGTKPMFSMSIATWSPQHADHAVGEVDATGIGEQRRRRRRRRGASSTTEPPPAPTPRTDSVAENARGSVGLNVRLIEH